MYCKGIVNIMKQTLFPMFILLFVLCSMMTVPLVDVQAQTTVHVYSGDSIQHAIDVLADPGDAILVHPGTYIGTITINKPVTLRSARGPHSTTIDGEWSNTVITISSNDVQIIGFTIMHGGQLGLPTPSGSGIYVLGDRCVIRGNRIVANDAHGIRLEEVEQARVVGNLLSENMGGIGGYNCERCSIKGNTIQRGYDGIWWSACHDNEIGWNRVSDHARFGIYVWGSNTNLIAWNRVVQSGESGIEMSVSYDNRLIGNIVQNNAGCGIYINQGGRCVIWGNLITRNEAHGVRLEDVEQARIVGNVIRENMGGLGGYGCQQCSIKGNTIRANYDGIWWSACHDNEIRWNRISDHGRFGMYVWGSNTNLIAMNRVVRSGGSGIETSVSYDNTITSNYAFDNAVYDLKTDDPSNNAWINNEYGTKNW